MDDLREVIARQEHAKELREINRYDWEYWPETRIREVIEANWPYEKDRFLAKADAALAAIKAAGFVVVPAEPTAEMEDAGIAAVHIEDGFTPEQAANFAKADHHLDCISGARLEVRACYRAMIEASNAPT